MKEEEEAIAVWLFIRAWQNCGQKCPQFAEGGKKYRPGLCHPVCVIRMDWSGP